MSLSETIQAIKDNTSERQEKIQELEEGLAEEEELGLILENMKGMEQSIKALADGLSEAANQ